MNSQVIVRTFLDANNNGDLDDTEELVGGLTVTGFDEAGNVYPFLGTLENAGHFELPVIPERLRVEVTGYVDGLEPGVAGSTSVFFVENGDNVLVAISAGPGCQT